MNLMKDKEFGSLKLSKLIYRMGDQITEPFCRIGSPKKLGIPSLICRNFETLRKVVLTHAGGIEI